MLPLTNVGRTLDVLGSLPQGIDSFNKLTGPAPSSTLPDIIKSGLSPKVGPSASFTDIMNGYRAAYSQPANPDSPSFKMFMEEEYAPLGINKWTHEQRNQFINSFPHPYETDEINGPTDLVGMKVNEYALGLPPLKYYEEVEQAAEAYDQDPSSKNKVQLQLKLAAFKHRKNEAANKKIISEVEQANPYDLALDDVASVMSQGPLDTARQPFLEGALGIARMAERIYSTFQGKQSAKDVLYRQQLDRAIRNRQYEQDLGPLSGVAGFAEDATTAASEMLPSLVVGGAAGVGLKAAGWGARGIGVGASLASQPVLGFQVWAQSYEQARQQGWSDKSAMMYGGAMAAVETAVEFFGGKLVSKFGFKTAERQLFDLFDNWGTIPVESLGKLAKTRMAQAAIGEGTEEAITEGIQKLVDHFSGMEPYEVTSPAELGEAIVKALGDVGYAFMLGGTVGAGMAGPTTLAESYAWAQRAQQIQANARKWAEKVAAGQSVDQGDQRYTFDHVRDIMAGVSREFDGAQTAFFNQEEGIAWLQQQDPLIQEGAEAAVRAGVSQSEYANLVSNLRPTTAAEIDHIIGLASAYKKAELINPTERQAEAPLPEHRLAELNARQETDQVSPEAEQYVQGWESNLTPKEAQFVYDKNLNEDEWKGIVQHRETGVASDPLVEEGEQEAPDGPVAVAEGKYEPDKTEVDAEPTDRLHDQAKQVIEEVPNATVEDVAQKLDVDEQRAEALVSDVMQDEPAVEVDDSPDAVLQFIKDNDDPSRSPREVAEELSDTYAPDVGQRSADDIQVVIEQIRAQSKPAASKPKKSLDEREVQVGGQKFKIFKQDGVWYSRDHKTGDVVDGRQGDQSSLWLGDDVAQAKKAIGEWQKAGKLPGGKQVAKPAPQAEQVATEQARQLASEPAKAKPPALPKKPKKEPPPIVPPERKPTAAQQKAYQKLLDQADKLKNPDAESRQAAQEALSRARKEAEASNPGASKERLDELVVPLAVNIAKANRPRKRPGYLPSLGTRSVQTVDPVPADKEAQFVQDLLAKAFPDAKFDFKVKRAGKKLIIETSDGRQVEVRLQRGGIKVSKEAKIRALKDRGLSEKEAEALDVIVYGRIDTQSNIDASGIPVVELTMSGGRQDSLGNKTKWVMMEHTLRHEMLHFFYYTGLIAQEDIEALRPMLPKGFSDTEALSYAAEYIDEGLMAKISDAFFEIMDALGVSFLLGKERLTKAKLRKIALGSTISSRLSEQAQNRSKAVKQATLDGGTRVFHPETNDFSLSGEFWLQDGRAEYADGDIGDMNHEAIAMDYAQRLIIDQFEGDTTAADDYVDWDQFERDVAKYMEENGVEETAEKSLFDLWVEESEVDQEVLAIAQGYGDPREWAARELGWVRLAGNDAEVYGLTKSRLKKIADGLADAHPDEDLDRETFTIYDLKSRKTYWDVPYAVIESGDMSALRDNLIQGESNLSVEVRPTTLKLKSWAAINRLKSPNDVVTEAYLRKQGVSPNELFWTGLEDALQLSGGRMTKGQVEGILSRSNFKVEDIEETEDRRPGRDVLLDQIAMRWNSDNNATAEVFYPNWTTTPGFLLKAFPTADAARKAMPEMLDRWIAAVDKLDEDADIRVRREAVRELMGDVESIAMSSYLDGTYNIASDGSVKRLDGFDWKGDGSIFDADKTKLFREVAVTFRALAVSLRARSSGNVVRSASWRYYTIGAALENAEGIEITEYRNILVEWNGYIPSASHAPGRPGPVRLRSMQQKSHWDDVASGTNILASARLTDMYHPDLGKTLVVEEIQSDLIQSIHEYKSAIETIKALAGGELAQEGSGAYMAIGSQAISKWKNAVRDLIDSDYYRFGDEQDTVELAYQRFSESGDVKHLMFKEIEDIHVPLESKYKEMMVKRVVQEAAAGGYDTISWPSGEWHHQMYYGAEGPVRSSLVRVQSVSEVDGFYLVQLSKREWNTDFGNHRFVERPYTEHRGLTKKGIRAVLGPILGDQAIDMIENGTPSEVEVPKSEFSSDRVKATGFVGREHEFVPRYDNPGLVTAYRDMMPMVFSNVMKKAKVKVEEIATELVDKAVDTGTSSVKDKPKFKLKYIRLNDAVREQAPEYSLFSISIKDRLASAVNVPLGKLKSNDFLNFLTDQFASGGNRPQVLIDAAAEEVGRSSDTIVKAAGAARKLEQAIANDPNHTRDQYLQELNQLQMTNHTSPEWAQLSAKFTPEVAEATKKLREIVDSLSEEVWELMKDINTRVNKAVFKYSPSMLKTISMRIAKAGNGAQVYLTTSYQNFQPPTRYERMYRLLGAVGLSPTGHPFRDKQLNNEQLKVKFIQTLSRVKWPDPGPWTGDPADPKYKKNPQKYAKDLANWKKAKKRAGKLKFEKFANMSATKKLEAIDNLFAYLLNKDTLDFGDRGRAPTGFANITKKRKLDDRLEEDRLIQELYGKIENPLENQVITIDALSSLVAELNIIKFIQTEGVAQGWVARKPEDYERGKNPRYVNLAPLHNDNLPSTKALEGYVADKWIAKAIHDMFSQKTDSGLLGAYMDLVQLTKRNKTIWGGPRSIVRNDFANYVISMLNGVPLLHMGAKFISYGREAYKIGRHGLESVPQDRQDLWNEAIRHGLGEDVTIAEQNAIKRRGMGMAENLSGPNQSLKRGMDKHLPYDVLRRTSQLLRNLYQLADTKHKVMQYEIQRPLFVKAALHDAGVNVGQYANDAAMLTAVRSSHPKLYESACRACAKEVRQTTPTYSLAPKIVQTISKRLPIGPFAIFSMEVLRSTAKRMEIMSSQLKSSNPHVQELGRMKLWGMFNYIMFVQVGTWLLKQLAGVSDEEDEANRKRMPFWMRNSRIMYLPWAGQPGDRYFVDLGFTDPMNIFYSGLLGTWREGPVEGVKEIFEPVTSEDLVFNAIISLARNADENRRPIYDEGVTRDRQAIQIFNFLRKKLQPGMADWMPKLIPGVNGGEYDPKTEAASFFGLRPYQVNRNDSDRFRTQEFYRRLMSTNSVVLSELRRKNFNPDRVRAIYRSAARKRRQIADEWREYMESSLYLGATDPVGDAVAFLEKSKDTINDVYHGRPIHYLPAAETLDKLRGMDRGYERVALIKDLYNEARYGATE